VVRGVRGWACLSGGGRRGGGGGGRAGGGDHELVCDSSQTHAGWHGYTSTKWKRKTLKDSTLFQSIIR